MLFFRNAKVSISAEKVHNMYSGVYVSLSNLTHYLFCSETALRTGDIYFDDFRFFGIVDLNNDFGPEYFMLSELKGAFNMPIIINGKQTTLPVQIERDEYWEEKSVEECEIFD